MAEWLDETEMEQAQEQAEAVEPQEFAEQPEAQEPQQPELPEKYQNKSFEDVVRMHSEAEKLIGKHSQEVGELRRVVDTYIQQAMAQTQTPAVEEKEVDFFDDPKTAVQREIARSPEVQEARQAAVQFRQSQTLAELQRKHPDMQEVVSDPKFNEWVQSSNARKRLHAQADNYDYDSADELLSTYKQLRGMAQETLNQDKSARQQAVRSAGTGGVPGSNSRPARKIYKRAQIIKMMKERPDQYEAYADEIAQAYAEGRVR